MKPDKSKKSDKSAKKSPIKKLSSAMIAEKMNILCVISVVKKNKLLVTMPGGLQGILPKTNISLWLDETESLTDLFKVGTVLPCRILHLKNNPQRKHTKIIFSADPCFVNANLSSRDFYIGMNLHASVKSKEEYGYIMDVGLPSVHAFLKDDAITNDNEQDGQLRIGQLLKCFISDMNSDCIQLQFDLAKDTVFPKRALGLRELIPGQRAIVTVRNVSSTHLDVGFFDLDGLVDKCHLEHPWSVPIDYTVGTELNATILYVDTATKVVHFTLNSVLYTKGVCDVGCSIGDLFPNAVVEEDTPTEVILKIQDKLRAVCLKEKFSTPSESYKINSTQRCRVMDLNLIDSIIYVSMKREHVADFKKYSDIKIGDVLQGEVKCVVDKGFKVEINPFVSGFIPKMHATNNNKCTLGINDRVKCKVLQIDSDNYRLILSAKKSVVASHGPILASYENVEIDSIVTGDVCHITKEYVIVKFFNNVSGIIGHKSLLSCGIQDPESRFHLGDTLSCRVLSCDPEKQRILLTLSGEHEITKIEIGKLYNTCIVVRVVYSDIEVTVDGNVTAILPLAHLSDIPNHCALLDPTIKVGKDLGPVLGFSNKVVNIVTRKRSFIDSIKSGQVNGSFGTREVVPCVLKKIVPTGFLLQMMGDKTGKAVFSNMADYCQDTFEFFHGMSLTCKIVQSNNLERILLSTRLSDVWDGDAPADFDWLKNCLSEKREIETLLTNSKDKVLRILAKNVNKVVKFHITNKTKDIISGYFNKVHKIAASAPNFEGVKARVGKCVKALVVNSDLISKCADLMLIPSLMTSEKSIAEVGHITDAKVILITNEFVLVTLLDGSNSLAFLPVKKHLNDLVGYKNEFTLGDVYSVRIVNNEISNGTIAELHFPSENTVKRKNLDEDIVDGQPKKRRKKKRNSATKEKTELKRKCEEINETSKKKLKKSISDRINDQIDHDVKNEVKCLDVGSKFEWNEFWETVPDQVNGEEDDEDSHTIDKTETTAKRKKRTQKEDDEIIFLKERALADESRLPETEDEFDRLVLASPDSSLVWLQYMAFHLTNVQVDKARAVCKRALSIINFREEQERLNTWVALLNLENTYGTDESLKRTIQDAEKNNDLLKINKHIIEMLQNDNKIEQAIDIFTSLIKRYKKDERIWIEYVTFLMKTREFDAARVALSRCQANLTSKQFVEVSSKMGHLEFKIGDAERGRTIFENLIANNPKRSDLWSVFIDLEVSAGNIDASRSLLERAISVNGSSRQMKSLFKKYFEFEKAHGDAKRLEHVKSKAEEYLNKQ